MPFPTTVNSFTPNLAHLDQVICRKAALDRLTKKFVFHKECEKFSFERNQGKTMRMHRWGAVANNALVPTSEGTAPVNSNGFGTRYLTVTLSQYTDSIPFSDFLLDVGPTDIIQKHAELLGEQAGLALDTTIRGQFDSVAGAAVTPLAGANQPITIEDVRSQRHLMQNQDIEYCEDGWFHLWTNPLVTFDMVNDPTANGYADIVKYTMPQKTALFEYEDRGNVLKAAQTRVFETTNTKVTAGSPNLYRAYMRGKGAMGICDMVGRGPSYVTDPKKENFRINIVKNLAPDAYNPEGKIGGFVAYNFLFAATPLDGIPSIGGTPRFRYWDAVSAIG